jgi:F-type H+-transporting ATPase subunit delta
MKITSKKYAQLLLEITNNKSENEIKIEIKKFIKLLIKKNQIKNYSKIITEFSELWNQKNNIIEAEVTTAHPISKEIQSQIEKFIQNKTKGNKIIIENKIDSKVISGAIIKYGNRILDNSLKNKINELKIDIIK